MKILKANEFLNPKESRKEFLIGAFLLSSLFMISRQNYLIFHSLAELFSIVVLFSVFLIVWNTKETVANDALIFLGTAYLFVGTLDLFHMISYKGVGVFDYTDGANFATQLWIAARYLEAVTLVIFSVSISKKINLLRYVIGYCSVTVFIILSIFVWQIFPACFVDGSGLTQFKKVSEYLICILLFSSFVILKKNRAQLQETIQQYLFLSIWLTILAELLFTFYISVYGVSNLIGHFFKIISFYLIYKAIIQIGLKEPYSLIFRKITENEKRYRQIFETNKAVKLIINPKDGAIIEANKAACRFYGYTEEQLKLLKITDINELDNTKVKDNMNKAVSGSKTVFHFLHRLASGETRHVEVYSGPVQYDDQTYLYSIIHDITERKKAERLIKKHSDNLNSIFNNVPNILLLVNEKGTVKNINHQGVEFSRQKKENLVGKLAGEVLKCFNSLEGKGCGRNPECHNCPIREKIVSTFQTGQPHSEEEGEMTFLINNTETLFSLLISTTLLSLSDGKKVLVTLTDITKLKNAEKEIRFRNKIQSARLKLIKISSTLSSTDLLKEFIAEAERLTQSMAGFYHFYNEDKKMLSHHTWSPNTIENMCGVEQTQCHYSIDQTGIWCDCIDKRKPVIQNDYEKMNSRERLPEGHAQIMRALVVPIVRQNKVVGILGVGNKLIDYNKDDVKAIQALADLAWETVIRRQAEETIAENDERLRIIIDNMAGWVWEIDKDYRYTYCSKKVQEILGYKPDEMMGKTPFDFMPKDGSEKIKQKFKQISRSKKRIVNLENWNATKDGKKRCMLTNGAPLIDEKGSLIGYRGVDADITEIKRTAKELHKSEEKFRLAFLTSPDAINLNRVSDGMYLEINEGFSDIMGYTREEAIGKSSLELNIWKHNEDRDRLVSILNKNGYVENFESEFLSKNGAIKLGLMSARVLTIENENVILSITRDITEQRKIESQYQQSQKMESIGTLAGGIAHDFNNILFPIIGHSEMLMEDLTGDDINMDSAKEIYLSALRAKELVHQILTFSRQQQDELKLMKIQPIMKEVTKMLRATIPTTIELKQNIETKCGMIKADPTQIHQMIMNLGTNAYHAMKQNGGILTLELKELVLGELDLIDPLTKPGKYACISIKDTGDGIPSHVVNKIFDPFFTTKEKGQGTGMGLSVVHGIVNKLKGAIQLFTKPGSGSEFNIYLPVENMKFSAVEEIFQNHLPKGSERILLVDDEQSILNMETQMLKRLGYEVTSFASSIEALEAFRKQSDDYDLIISDLAMPKMPGDKFARELLKINSEARIMLCTGFSDKMTPERIKAIGIKDILIKPIVSKELAEKIRQVICE